MTDERSEPTAPPSAAPPSPAVTSPPAATESAPPRITIQQFLGTQLRVARVIAAERVANADRLLKLQVDLGTEQRQIVAGIARSYEPEALVGKRVIIVANLEPAKIRGVESQGMLLAADAAGRPVIATFEEDVPLGSTVR